jgi:hypothetical protein
MATIRFHRFTDPRKGSLVGEQNTRRILGPLIGAQSCGRILSDEIDALLAERMGE